MLSIGIDLSASSKRPSSMALIDQEGNLIRLTTFGKLREFISSLDEVKPTCIGIDSPLTLPLGLDCLEEDCGCSPANGHKGRLCEVELAQMGIGCFYTGKKSIIKKLIYRGLRMKEHLFSRGYTPVEVYAYATKLIIFGNRLPPKSKPESIKFLRDNLPGLVPGADSYANNLNHDRSDAILAAHTAWLHTKGQTDLLGSAEESHIAIPRANGKVFSSKKARV